MGLWVWDGGKSESLPVMGGIGVEPVVEVRETRRLARSLHAQAWQTSTGSLVTREFGKLLERGMQMTAVATLAGAPLTGPEDWNKGQPARETAPGAYREVAAD
jgi:hypothetical protein